MMAMTRKAAILTAMLGLFPGTAQAQLDPLLFLKEKAPNVLLLVDVGERMQRDAPSDPSNPFGTSSYYDPFIYPFNAADAGVNTSLGLDTTNTSSSYRRKYVSM